MCSPASGPMSLLLSKVSLPTASWIVQRSGFCKVEQPEGCTSAVVTRSINIQSDLTWTAFVHGKELARSCSLMIDIGEFLDLNSLQHLVETLHKSRVCCGNYEQQFVSLLTSRNGNTSELIGFTNLSDINNHLSVLERACRADGEDENDEADLPQLATRMLVFMVRGICSSLKFPYAQFPVRSLAGDTLHPIVWECLEHVESLGFKVLAFVSDGASCNRKFYSMHGKGSAGISHKITNPYAAEDRPIFFISDIPHLLKTVRNSWANSHAHSNTRHLWVCA